VACLLRCLSRFLSGVPKRLPLLADGLQLFAVLLLQRPGLLGEYPEPFCLLSRRFRQRAVLFGTATLLICGFPMIFGLFPRPSSALTRLDSLGVLSSDI